MRSRHLHRRQTAKSRRPSLEQLESRTVLDAAGLVAHWAFESATNRVVADIAPADLVPNPGTMVGNANINLTVRPTGVLALDGAGDYMTVPVSTETGSVLATQRTVSLWFNAQNTTSRQILFEQGGSGRGINIYLESGNVIVGGWNKISTESNWAGTWLSAPASAGQWHHVAVVLNGTSTVQPNALVGYLNGIEIGRGAGSQLWPQGDATGLGAVSATTRVSSGAVSGNGIHGLNGYLDDVQIYDRALLPSEIATLAGVSGGGGGGGGTTPEVLASWTFQDSTGTVVPDSSTVDAISDTGTLVNQAVIHRTSGLGGGSLKLDGVSDYVGVNVSAETGNSLTTQRTVSLWFFAQGTSSRQLLLEQGGSGRGLNIYLESGNVTVGAWNTTAGESNWGGTWLSTPASAGRWHHVALVLNGTSTVQPNALVGYLNGVEFGRGAGSQLWAQGDPLGIGAVNGATRIPSGGLSGTGNHSLNGYIDEVKIHGRALSASEVQSLAQGTPVVPGVTVPPPTTGIRLTPGTSIANAVAQNPAGTSFILAPGTYNRQSIVPKNGNTFTGENGAILDGQNATQYAFYGSASNVTIRNLEIKNYSSLDFRAAIDIENPGNGVNGTGWVLDDLDVRNNRSHGISLGNNTTVKNSRIIANGLLGIGGRDTTGGLIEGNTISGNNTRNAYPNYHGGGIKTSDTVGLVIRNNVVSNNTMVGIWCDIGCSNWTVEGNTISSHFGIPGTGIHFEISTGAVIRNNTITTGGRPSPAWAWGAGIQISTSRDVLISGNTISDYDSGIGIVQQNRGILVDNITVIGNTMWDSGRNPNLQTGVVTDTGDSSIFNRNFVFQSNIYRGARAPVFWWQGGQYTWAQWRARGFDTTGSYTP